MSEVGPTDQRHSGLIGRREYVPIELRREIFRGSDVVRRGLLTPQQLRAPQWRRIFRDVYVHAELPDNYRLRCEAAALVLPAGAVLTSWSAACLGGVTVSDADQPVYVLAPLGCRFTRDGFSVRHARLPDGHVIPGEPPSTVPPRTAWEIAGGADLVEAVVGLDILLGQAYVRPELLARWAASRPRSRPTRAIRLADGRSESPQESRARVRLLLAGLPRPVPQYEVYTSDALFVARLDLAWPEHKVACEYDGGYHAEINRFRADRARLNKLVDEGWVILHMTADDLSNPILFDRFIRQLRAALERG
jgi:very-short-patch-repair endonuclease